MLPLPFQAPTPTLTLKKFEVNPELRTLDISGRASGVVGFLLNLFGVSPTTDLNLAGDRIEMNQAKISAQSRKVFPLATVESTECGHRRNFGLLAAAVGFAIAALSTLANNASAAMVLGMIAAVMFVGFLASQRLFLAVFCGSQDMQILFKESKVNGVKIDRNIAMEAIQIINDRVVESS